MSILFLAFAPALWAADGDLKPGDIIGPQNWQRVQGMIGENLLNRIKQGYTFKIKEALPRRSPREFVQATERHSDRVTLGFDGQLLNYVAGLPFPKLDLSDAQVGLKLAWNFSRRWVGDDYKEGGATATGKLASHSIEKDGSERRSEAIIHHIKTRGRISLDPKPVVPGYEHIEWMQIRADEYPRDTSGTTTLEIRYIDPNKEDDLYIYVPSIRRVRRAPPIQRCATLAPTEFTFDDINSFNGKLTDFNYKYIGQKQMLGNFTQEHVPFHRKAGDYLPVDERWELANTFILEITPKSSDYCYPRKVLYLDQSTYQAIWVMTWTAKGNYWKEDFNYYAQVRLADGQDALSITSPVIVNLQNGRSTILTTTRAFNQSYQPSLFTLATLQTVMRGGALR